jgi:hypothetical protein
MKDRGGPSRLLQQFDTSGWDSAICETDTHKTSCNEELDFLHLKCVKTHLQASTISKICQGYTPDPR